VTSRLDVLTQQAKRRLPSGPKEAARRALHGWGRATAALRPLPEVLVLGTKRGGTTSLWNYLLEHPGVLPMWPAAENLKSPHYFYWHHDRGPAWYRSHFATGATRALAARRLGHPVVTGEASPYYLYDPRVPARVAELLPHARLVVMLRDPVERAYSHYKERVRAGVEPLSFDDALEAEDDRLAGEVERMLSEPGYYSRPHDWFSYRDRGVYLPQLLRWEQHVPAESILVVRSEDFYADPQAEYDRVLAHAGLPSHRLREAKRWNYKPAAGMSDAARTQLRAFYAPSVAALEEHLGRDLGWGRE
jgi:hypothetical protein